MRSRVALLWALGIDNFGSGLFLPLALVYASRVVGLDLATAGTTVAAATLLGLGAPPVAARTTHRFGPRVTVAVAQLVQGAGALGYLVAQDVAGVFLAAGLMAAGTQLFYSSVFVLVADASSEVAKERPFALVGMVRAATFGLGTLTSAIALALADDAALRTLVAVDAATFVLAAGLLARYVETGRVEHSATLPVGPRTVLRDRPYVMLMAAVCLLGLTVDCALVGTPVFVLEVLEGPPWLPGTLLAGGTALTSVLGVRVVGLLAGRRRTRSLQVSALAYATFGILLMAALAVPSAWLVPYACGAWLLFVAANKVFYPVAGALSEALPPGAARSGYMATYQYAFTAAQVLTPGVVGLFAVAAWLPWAVTAACALLGGVLLQRLAHAVPLGKNVATVSVPA